MRRTRPTATWLLALLLVSGGARNANAEWAIAADVSRSDRGRLLDVPYLPQTEDLCGGAAVAMVLRYWGERQVYPDDFAALVDRSLAGIRTDVLTGELRRRGWRALPAQRDSQGGVAWIREHVDAGRPIVALIAVGPARFHYVVVVAVTGDRVVIHDPARAPYQVLPRAEFDAAWAGASRWAVLVLPASTADRSASDAPVAAAPAPDRLLEADGAATACAPLVDAMVVRAKAGDLDGAGQGLQTATALCPEAATAWRELAGVRFLQSRWAEAATYAEQAATLEPEDHSGWDLLATSQFLDGRPIDALRSWNRLDRPRVDVVRVVGRRRTPDPVIVGAVDLAPPALLTPERFARAARRLDEVPSLATARLRYQPLDGGLAGVDAAVVERPVAPRGVVPVGALLAHAAIHREVRIDLASPTGSGERWSAGWRWWNRRPRVTFALATPSPGWLPGVTTIDGLWERASYAVTPPGQRSTVAQQSRRRAGFVVADWATSRLRWQAGAALDRWDDAAHASLDGGVDVRLADDRVALGTDLAGWAPLGTRRGFVRGALTVAARSHTTSDRGLWSMRGGLVHASAAAPFDLWPGAGTGLARTPLLRAHPLLADGVVTGPVFGRRLIHGTVEHERRLRRFANGALGLAAFVDGARAWHRASPGGRWHADAGLGARLTLPFGAGTLRLDVARGLRDARHVISAGWITAWPGH